MRTVKRKSLKLNKKKFEILEDIAKSYAKEKQYHLKHFQTGSNFANTKNFFQYQNFLVESKHKSLYGLQARMFKLAAKDAYETELKYWAAIAEEIKPNVFKLAWNEKQRHYAFWLLKFPQRLAGLITSKAEINEKILLSLSERKQVQNYLRRTIRNKFPNRPKVKLGRSFVLDANMYDIENLFPQIIAISTKERRKRINIPLLGLTKISGNIKVVLFPEKHEVEIYTSHDLMEILPNGVEDIGLDFGVTEVFTDNLGNVYGKEINELIKNRVDYTTNKGKKRGKLHSVRKKYLAKGKIRKAKNIQKYNLSKKKLNNKRQKFNITSQRIVNQSINELIKNRNPKVIAGEKLDFRGKAQNKNMSSRINISHRAILKDRLEFKALAKGFSYVPVNPAYTSQMCSNCGYLDQASRCGDTFHCSKCMQGMSADFNGAKNCKQRLYDKDITLGMPKEKVKEILLARYNTRLEYLKIEKSKSKVTVSGQTLDRLSRIDRQSESETLNMFDYIL